MERRPVGGSGRGPGAGVAALGVAEARRGGLGSGAAPQAWSWEEGFGAPPAGAPAMWGPRGARGTLGEGKVGSPPSPTLPMASPGRKHTGEKPFECPKCGKCYFRRENLLEHEARNCMNRSEQVLAAGPVLMGRATLASVFLPPGRGPQETVLDGAVNSRQCSVLGGHRVGSLVLQVGGHRSQERKGRDSSGGTLRQAFWRRGTLVRGWLLRKGTWPLLHPTSLLMWWGCHTPPLSFWRPVIRGRGGR